MRIQLHAMIAFACLWGHQVNAEDWTRFRGPNGQGVSAEVGLPTKWSGNDNVVWKTPIPGSAWSSPIILGDQIFLTTATEEGAAGRILCVNRRSGEVDWNVEVHRQELGDKRKENSYATPTPVTDGKRVYAVFADGAIVAVDLTGKTALEEHRREIPQLARIERVAIAGGGSAGDALRWQQSRGPQDWLEGAVGRSGVVIVGYRNWKDAMERRARCVAGGSCFAHPD